MEEHNEKWMWPSHPVSTTISYCIPTHLVPCKTKRNGHPWSSQKNVKMGVGLYTFCSLPTSSTIPLRSKSNHNSFIFNTPTKSLQTHLPKPANFSVPQASKCSGVEEMETHQGNLWALSLILTKLTHNCFRKWNMMRSYGVPFMGFFLETGIDRDQGECLAWAWVMPHFLFCLCHFGKVIGNKYAK